MSRYTVGLDLGQTSDYTAIVVTEQVPRTAGPRVVVETAWVEQIDPSGAVRSGAVERARTVEETYTEVQVRHLARVRGEPYPAIVRQVAALLTTPPLVGAAELVVDQTGVGAAVVDMLREAGLRPVAVTITGGNQVIRDGLTFSVPKRDLVAAVQVGLQRERLKIAAGLPLAGTLKQELLTFKVTIDPRTAHDSYAAWREAEHDDLVLAVALACWYPTVRPPWGAT